MIFDVAMQGRKLFWLGEDTEIFAAKDRKSLISEFHDMKLLEGPPECEAMPTNWQVLWKGILCEEPIGGAKLHKPGGDYFLVPMITFVKAGGQKDSIICLGTAYN